MKKTIIQIILIAIAIVLGYLTYQSIMEPVNFNKEKKAREKVVIQYLKDIRSAEFIYKQLNNRYTGSFDTLIHFMDSAEIPVVKMIPDPNDTTYTLTINDTIGYVKVADSLFRNQKNVDYHHIDIIPFSGGKKFQLKAGVIKKGGIKVNVFEVKAPFETYLKGMNEQLIVNLKASRKELKKYPGLKVGSMTEPSTDGNWE
jgi:predicted small secreted protein